MLRAKRPDFLREKLALQDLARVSANQPRSNVVGIGTMTYLTQVYAAMSNLVKVRPNLDS
jgi:hypothetical protein